MRRAVSSRDSSRARDEGARLERRAGGGVFLLPGGFVDEQGNLHREVELQALSGQDEEFLASVPADLCSARLVTQLLLRCIRRLGSLPEVTERSVAGLPIGDREFLIVQLRGITFGDRVEVLLECPNRDCRSSMVVPVLLSKLPVKGEPVRAGLRRIQVSSGEQIEYRLPIGEDQEALASVVMENEGSAVIKLLARCIRSIDGKTRISERAVERLSAGARQEIETDMQSWMPDLDLELESTCPECAARFSSPLSLGSACLAEMKRDLRELEREVHVLASQYHWGEREILSLPRPKRRRYLDLLESELNATDLA